MAKRNFRSRRRNYLHATTSGIWKAAFLKAAREKQLQRARERKIIKRNRAVGQFYFEKVIASGISLEDYVLTAPLRDVLNVAPSNEVEVAVMAALNPAQMGRPLQKYLVTSSDEVDAIMPRSSPVKILCPPTLPLLDMARIKAAADSRLFDFEQYVEYTV